MYVSISDDELFESPFARDETGQMVPAPVATLAKLNEPIQLTIDGIPITVPAAVPKCNDQGAHLYDEKTREIIPRATTIYDAVLKLGDGGAARVPVLCHQEHLTPIGVCRVCSVLIARGGRAGARLFPACSHWVENGMEIHTHLSEKEVTIPGVPGRPIAGPYVKNRIRQLLSLLALKHLHFDEPADDRWYHNELLTLAEQFQVAKTKLPAEAFGEAGWPATKVEYVEQFGLSASGYDARRRDDSSLVVRFDPNLCILCDRCVRSCRDVKPFEIISHTGFGRRAEISFGLNYPMDSSGCVACGECAVSCPTGALSFKATVYGKKKGDADGLD